MSQDGSYGCVAPKLCGRIVDSSYGFLRAKAVQTYRTVAKAVSTPKLCGRIKMIAKALRAKAVVAYWTVAKALRTKAVRGVSGGG